ncbi:putative RNA-directed DNA polymerase from transposon X-element [Nephila pilipes]|uniref:Putative RNA-directed DNA polymerase from transposon X-element n=1 Tax=Nephila pilipes TaxID=299642 RepID=A0A8X6UPK4_NEPPI|nr:putative RNA-directed DNA polymerase from transposon X-element [Nephila pilipes]
MIVDTKQMEFTFDAMNRLGNWPFCFTGTLLDDAEETVWLSLKLWSGLAKETVVLVSERRIGSDFLSQRFCTTRFGDSLSSFKQNETGLPQGTVISPTLFNIFINDLHALLSSDGLTSTALFADDLVIWCRSPKRDKSKLNTTLNSTRLFIGA